MKPLTFSAQLSLDFIFAGIKEFPNIGEEIMSDVFDIQLGGGTLVYPIVLARLGVPTRVLIKSASSNHSQFAMTLLQKYPIQDIVMFQVDDYDPVMSTAVISMEADRSFICKSDSRSMLFDDDILLQYYLDSKVIFATESNMHLLGKFKENGSIIVFDVGWTEDLSVGKYESILKFVDYFTPNDKEALKMTGAKTVEESLVILSKYVKYPVVSCGAKGCMAMINNVLIHVPIPISVMPVDMTGAGDNFMAGLIYGIYMNELPEKCLEYANCAGTLSTMGLGCYGHEYSLEDLQNLLKEYVK